MSVVIQFANHKVFSVSTVTVIHQRSVATLLLSYKCQKMGNVLRRTVKILQKSECDEKKSQQTSYKILRTQTTTCNNDLFCELIWLNFLLV